MGEHSKLTENRVETLRSDLLQVQKVKRVLSSQGGNKAGRGPGGSEGEKKRGPRDFLDGPWLRLCVSTVVETRSLMRDPSYYTVRPQKRKGPGCSLV